MREWYVADEMHEVERVLVLCAEKSGQGFPRRQLRDAYFIPSSRFSKVKYDE
jgi:hypothetical protein